MNGSSQDAVLSSTWRADADMPKLLPANGKQTTTINNEYNPEEIKAKMKAVPSFCAHPDVARVMLRFQSTPCLHLV